ncbi:MAG: DUF3067 family protein [Okeania sp. SIO2H7]|nr:DUF3067 family protein [Okeania sp. SIO2H7]
MNGNDLHQLLLDKWGKSYDVRLRRVRGQILVQVMWKYLEQASFPMTEAQYFGNLEAIATYINGFAAAEQVEAYILNTKEKPRLGKTVNIALDLGDRASEWLLEDM